MTDPELERLETILGRALLAGVLSSSACLAIGLVLWISGSYPTAAERVLAAGLIVLMATPILRVVVSLIEYVRLRDWLFAATTLMVLAVLMGAVAVALGR